MQLEIPFSSIRKLPLLCCQKLVEMLTKTIIRYKNERFLKGRNLMKRNKTIRHMIKEQYILS